MKDDSPSMGRRVTPSTFGEVLTDIDQQLEKYDDIVERANRFLKKLGIDAPRRPLMREIPELPGSVSEMTDAELGDAQGAFAVWASYFGELIPQAELNVETRKSTLAYLLAKLKDSAIGGSQAEKADKARIDPRYIDADTQLLEARYVMKRLTAAFDSMERQRKVCSRYVELRTREIDGTTRTANVQSRRRDAPRFRR